MRRFLALLALAGLVGPGPSRAADDGRLELKDGDRVVMVGDAFFERDHEYGYLETELTSLWPDRDITFRNLGWTGDTVWGDARAAFETAVEGFQRRRDLVLALKPTVILVSCGMNESFDGEAGLPKFVEGLNRMLDGFAPSGAKVVLISPIVHEKLPPPLPDPAEHNRSLGLYRDALAKVARERGLIYVDMSRPRTGDGAQPEQEAAYPATDNGIHLNAFGYRQAAKVLGEALKGRSDAPWTAHVSGGDAPRPGPSNTAPISDLERTDAGLKFRSLEGRLPDPWAPAGVPAPLAAEGRRLVVGGLKPGRYALRIDGQPVAEASAEGWAEGVAIRDCPERRQVEALRRAIVEKNRLLFYRWRPENETYLYGFRKHEQGQNAAEIPEFDPLVSEKEAEIAGLRKPVAHAYELVREEEDR